MAQNQVPQHVESPDFLPTQGDATSAIEKRLQTAERRQAITNTVIGVGFLAAAGAAAYGIANAHDSEARLGHEMPFSPPVQEALNDVDNVMEVAGGAGLLLSLGIIGGVKVFASRSPRLESLELGSSKDLTNDGHNANPSLGRRVLRRTVAGSVPVIAGIAVGAGTFMSNVGQEMSAGPDRAIDAFNNQTPGDTMIVQDSGAMPMVESNVSARLSAAIQREAARREVEAVPLDLNLGTITYGNESAWTLTAGLPITSVPKVNNWKPADGCNNMPVIIDESSRMKVGSEVTVNGITAEVAGTMHSASAIDRIAVGMSSAELKDCAKHDPEAGDHAIILDTDQKTAREVLQAADQGIGESAAVISKEDYKHNSEVFWDSNAKPLTNLFDLASLLTDVVAIGGAAGARLLRNRQHWARALVAGIPASQLRATEMLRAAKDGVAATILGLPLGTAVTTLGANVAVIGFDAGTTVKAALVGSGIGTIGAAIGTAFRLVGLRKKMNPKEFAK